MKTLDPLILLRPREAAEMLGVSERTVWNLTAPRGPIPCVRIGRSVRYSQSSLRAWVEQQQEQPVHA